MEQTQMIRKQMLNEKQYRALTFSRGVIDEEQRIAELSFSSDEPVDRSFGYEILDHNPKSVRMGRIANNAPLLFEHQGGENQIGVVLKVDFKNGRGIATVKFSRSAKGTEYFNDVVDGIRGKVSVGYFVHDMKLEEKGKDGLNTYRVTDWEPFEVSLVSVPADDSVGIGRSAEQIAEAVEPKEIEVETKIEIKEERTMETNSESNPTINVDVVVNETRNLEIARFKELRAIGQSFKNEALADELIANGGTPDQLRAKILEKMKSAPIAPQSEIGMTKKEVKRFSFVRAINAAVTNNWAGAEFEKEASDAVAKKLGRSAKGFFLPFDVMTRDMSVGTATAGGNLVATNLLASSFIDILHNNMVATSLGVTRLGGLSGDIAIPRKTAYTTATWVAEDGSDSGSNPTVDQVSLSPKTLTANSTYSRKLLQQSSLDVENFVATDLALNIALGMDSAIFNGSGASNQPTGIRNQSGVNTITTATDGSAPTWANIVGMETAVNADNANMGSRQYVFNANAVGKLKTTEKASSTAQFIINDGLVNGYGYQMTNQLPSTLTKGSSGATLSSAIFGNFSDVIVGEWGVLDITVDPYSNSSTGKVKIVVFKDCDIAVRHPESFCIFDNMITV